jgi:hypothetical protein
MMVNLLDDSNLPDKEKRILLSEEVLSLILKGAIERVQDPFQSPGFYSRLFYLKFTA